MLAARLTATRRDTRLTVVQGSAAELAAAVGEPVDAVVSGLPWTVMPHNQRGHILDAVNEVLAPGGRFTTFAYLHAAWTPPGRTHRRTGPPFQPVGTLEDGVGEPAARFRAPGHPEAMTASRREGEEHDREDQREGKTIRAGTRVQPRPRAGARCQVRGL
ncbi:hypothetical protein ACGFXB_44315 [Streptomyces canus]|uniref:hypothetical protein n=1 Tax=Streptomyces canus TaxID=58343 RepID=UPI0037107CE1